MQNGRVCDLLIQWSQVSVYLVIPFHRLCGYYCLRQLMDYWNRMQKGYIKRENCKNMLGPGFGGLCLQRRVPWYQCTTKYGVTKDTDVGGMPELACTITGFVVLAILSGPTKNIYQ